MSEPSKPRVVPAKSARGAAKLFNYGNIIAVLVPFPLLILWFGASMFFYALNRHHPNAKVGHYTQQAAYRFYGLIGLLIPVGTYFPAELDYFLAYWAITAAIIIPWSVIDLVRIHRDHWEDTVIDDKEAEHG